jgi:hypothetical protein
VTHLAAMKHDWRRRPTLRDETAMGDDRGQAPTAGASAIITPTSYYRQRSGASFRINGGEGRPSSKLVEE